MRKKLHIIMLLICSSMACVGCGTERESFISQSGGAEFDRHVPETTITLEDKVKQAADAYAVIQNSYQQIQKAAEDTSIDQEIRQAVQQFEDTYGGRIEELENLDFSDLSEDEMDALISELRGMVTAAREITNVLPAE